MFAIGDERLTIFVLGTVRFPNMAARFRCETHGFSCSTLGELGRHARNSKRQRCVRVVSQKASWRLDDPKEFGVDLQNIDEVEMEELANFWVTLIQNTGNNIRRKGAEFGNL